MPQITDPVKKQEFKVKQKKHGEVSKDFVEGLFNQVIQVRNQSQDIDEVCEDAFRDVIDSTVAEDIDSYTF